MVSERLRTGARGDGAVGGGAMRVVVGVGRDRHELRPRLATIPLEISVQNPQTQRRFP